MTVRIQGNVTSGLGEGEHFVQLEGYADQFREQLGYEPYPGTLNLELDSPIDTELKPLAPVRIDGWESETGSFGAVDCYPASFPQVDTSIQLHVVVPDRTDHDTSTLEIISPRNLRKTLGLSDEAVVAVEIRANAKPS